MKKQALIHLLISFIIVFTSLSSSQPRAFAEQDPNVIPDEAIRLRILANSNSDADQSVKRLIRDKVNESINTWVKDLTSIEASRKVIRSHLGEISNIVSNELEAMNLDGQNYKVEFAKVQFPTKLYGNYVYPAGKYEAVLITLGEGLGDNWWCVLFPPLCFLDFDNGDAVKDANNEKAVNTEQAKEIQTEKEEVKVEFFLVTVFDGLVDFVKNLF
ncbi:stage II sporulation protein R [Pseudalkalibacillus caeni]|uniref:Stage II sporulation protein R n=1 Tax=Exobacillus caeni TaxID=2574798 RepID=A0A5R9F309_9BACL|nr:stage II sporulation protein R [Pseudalkalibacillus caeni]TLS36706.1 stage II sporulation protein R [Pseudalkalibacillus caeni]